MYIYMYIYVYISIYLYIYIYIYIYIYEVDNFAFPTFWVRSRLRGIKTNAAQGVERGTATESHIGWGLSPNVLREWEGTE
jgi:hypothetical protein